MRSKLVSLSLHITLLGWFICHLDGQFINSLIIYLFGWGGHFLNLLLQTLYQDLLFLKLLQEIFINLLSLLPLQIDAFADVNQH